MPMDKEQLEIFHTFKDKVSDVIKPHHDDLYLQKWLTARKYDVKKAEQMFRKSMKWRESVGADDILKTWSPPEVIKKYYPGGIAGRDKEGNVVFIDPFGQVDLKGIMMAVQKEDIIKSMVHRLETLERQRRLDTTPEKPIHHCIHIQDMAGFSSKIMFRTGLSLVIEILDMLEQNYPETLKTTYIINAPTVFVSAYNIIKRFINKEIAEKFKMPGSNWQEEILKVVDPSQLPQYYGGEMVDDDGDPKCSSMICYGGEIPKQYYLKKGASSSETNANFTTIGMRGSFSYPVTVPTDSCRIRWVFSTEKGDLVFTVLREESGALKPLPPGPRKLNCDAASEDGVIDCAERGQYVLRFENPSLFSQRKLHHFVEVLDGDADQRPSRESIDEKSADAASDESIRL